MQILVVLEFGATFFHIRSKYIGEENRFPSGEQLLARLTQHFLSKKILILDVRVGSSTQESGAGLLEPVDRKPRDNMALDQDLAIMAESTSLQVHIRIVVSRGTIVRCQRSLHTLLPKTYPSCPPPCPAPRGPYSLLEVRWFGHRLSFSTPELRDRSSDLGQIPQ